VTLSERVESYAVWDVVKASATGGKPAAETGTASLSVLLRHPFTPTTGRMGSVMACYFCLPKVSTFWPKENACLWVSNLIRM
jgi:hypothetical protein